MVKHTFKHMIYLEFIQKNVIWLNKLLIKFFNDVHNHSLSTIENGQWGIRLASHPPHSSTPNAHSLKYKIHIQSTTKPGASCERFCTRDVADLIGEADAESKEETTHNEHGEVLGSSIQGGTKKE